MKFAQIRASKLLLLLACFFVSNCGKKSDQQDTILTIEQEQKLYERALEESGVSVDPSDNTENWIKDYEVDFGKVIGKKYFKRRTSLQRPSFSKLLAFLRASEKGDREYILGTFQCLHFAHALYNEAIEKGYEARYVSITFKDKDGNRLRDKNDKLFKDVNGKETDPSHAVVAFSTSDLGIVYIDFTASGKVWSKKLAWVSPREPYRVASLLTLDTTGSNFDNSRNFFKSGKQRFKEMVPVVKEADAARNELLKKVNNKVAEMNAINAKIKAANSKIPSKNESERVAFVNSQADLSTKYDLANAQYLDLKRQKDEAEKIYSDKFDEKNKLSRFNLGLTDIPEDAIITQIEVKPPSEGTDDFSGLDYPQKTN
jgi:hypothetical protein